MPWECSFQSSHLKEMLLVLMLMKGYIAFACDDCIGSSDAYTQSTSCSCRCHWIVLDGPCWYFVIQSFFWNSKMSSRKRGWEYFEEFLSSTENPYPTHSWSLARNIPGLFKLLPCDQGTMTAVMNEEEQELKLFVVLPSMLLLTRCGLKVSRQER